MDKKGLIFVLAVLLLILSSVNLMVVLFESKDNFITGYPTSGEVGICINNPPSIETISNQNAIVNQLFTLQISTTTTAAQGSNYYDNTSLFDINNSGFISFTPSAPGDIGTHHILITLQGSGECADSNANASTSFILTIPAPAETPAGAAAAGGGGGGGGGAGLPYTYFQLSEQFIKASLKETESLEKRITIENLGETYVNITLENPLKQVLKFIPEKINLNKGEKKEIKIIFNPAQDVKPDIYTGIIKFIGTYKTNTIAQLLSIILEVESEEVLIDVSLDVPKKTILPEEELKATVTLIDLRKIQPLEVDLTYLILDLNNTIYYQETEKVTVDGQASFSKSFKLPEGMPEGKYVLGVKAAIAYSVSSATELFEIKKPETKLAAAAAGITTGLPLLVIISGFALLIAITYIILYLNHLRNKKRKVNLIKSVTITPDNSTPELKKKLRLLSEAYQRRYIQKESYLKARKDIEKKLRERE